MIRSTLSNNLNLSRCNSNLNLFATSSSSSIQNFIRRASTTSIPLDSQSSNSKSSTTSSPKPNSPYTIFDVQAKLKQRDRAATRIPVDSDGKLGDDNSRGEASRQTDYVRDLAAQNLSERLLDIKRNFPKVVELGSGAGYLKNHIDVKGVGIEELLMCDVSEKALNRDKHLDSNYPFNISRQVIQSEVLPFEENSLDCIISPNSLHWVNDLPGLLIQIKRALKPDGVFLASILGGETLFELRTSLQLAELEREGGISPRVSPMTDTRDIASLLSRAGFTLPTIDLDEIEVNYPSMFELMEDLRDMGESNAVINRRSGLRRDTMLSASAIYQGMHGNDDGTVPATFGIIYVIGWKPAPTQPKPLERGSGKHSLKDILGSEGDGTTEVEGGKGKGEGDK